MRYLKSLISFTLPLFILLMALSVYLSINSLVADYKQKILNDYSILVVANTPITKDDVKELDGIEIKNIQTLSRDDIIDNLKNQISQTSLKLLEQKLPFFYKIYLVEYPTATKLNHINEQLKKMPSIKRVETFATNHNKIYALLLFAQQLVKIVLVLLILFVVVLLSKQVNIWFYEHENRIQIIQYHGGSIFYSALPVIKVAMYGSLLAIIISIISLLVIKQNISFILSSEFLAIFNQSNVIEINYIYLTGLSFIISIVSILGVLLKYKTK